MEKSLKDKILKEQQRFSDLLVKYDNLRLSPLLSKETQVELTELQATIKEVNGSLQKVEVIQQYWSAKVTIITSLHYRYTVEYNTYVYEHCITKKTILLPFARFYFLVIKLLWVQFKWMFIT